MKVLKGESDGYDNIPFSKTVAWPMRRRLHHHIGTSNNVTVMQKASGIIISQLYTNKRSMRKKDTEIRKRPNRGFLTLYNRLDDSGFSKSYAVNLKNSLSKRAEAQQLAIRCCGR
jgi:hypothetical protein